MKKINLFILAAVAAVFLAACGAPPANNSNTNTNANAAKPTAAAPTAETLLTLDKQANEAYLKGDSKPFEGMLSDKFVMYEAGQRMDKAAVVKRIASGKCDVKDGWKLEEPQMASIDADTYVLTYKGTFDGSCTGPDGKSMKIPSPVRGASVWVRSGDKWQAVFHGENPILDPKNPAPAAKPVAKAEGKKDEPAKSDTKKDDKTATSNSNSNTAANTTAAAPAPAKSANTDALVKVELAGWEAWKAKDAKKLEEVSSKNLSIVGADGIWIGKQADAIKYWAEMPCENIKTVGVTEGFASALSPTVEILTGKGSADGTCFGQKNGSQDFMSIYVKEGDAWKLAFSFSYPVS